METITLKRLDEDTIWVTADVDQVGTESTFKEIRDEGAQMLIALAEFLGYEPTELFNFDDINI